MPERSRRDLYTDIWASMGEEAEIPERVKLLTPLQSDYGNARQRLRIRDVIFLHCLPSFHDFETDHGEGHRWIWAMISAKSPTKYSCQQTLQGVR